MTRAKTRDRADSDTLCHDPEGGLPRLLEIMRRLRDPETGCPWDVEQTFETIAPYTIEEAYEVSDAIDRGDWADLKSELGDLLLQTVYQTQIGAERGLFDFHDVANGIAQKMLDRHPRDVDPGHQRLGGQLHHHLGPVRPDDHIGDRRADFMGPGLRGPEQRH